MLNFAKARLGPGVGVVGVVGAVGTGLAVSGCGAQPGYFDLLVAAAFVVGLAWFLVVRARRRAEVATDVVARVGRFTVVFARGVTSSTLPVEVDLCAEAEDALVSLGWDVGHVRFWPVRSAGQDVVYRGRRLPWRDVPGLVGVPARGDGYGGMMCGGDVYVAFYHEGREADALMAHELTHCHVPTTSHSHPVFLSIETKLLAEMRRSK